MIIMIKSLNLTVPTAHKTLIINNYLNKLVFLLELC